MRYELALIPLFSAAFMLACGIEETGANSLEPDTRGDGPLQIVISLKDQKLSVMRGDRQIATSPISTGKPGHSTPPGIYSILHKKRRHFSNLYDGAPMPYMQRLTWTGIALHGSNSVPDYPASHGCIRLPDGFDEELYSMTDVGTHVIVNGDMISPVSIRHRALPQPQAGRRYDPMIDHWRLRLEMGMPLAPDTAREVSTAALLYPVRDRISLSKRANSPPIRILITRRPHAETNKDLQRLLNKLGYDAGFVDGIVGPSTRAAIRGFQKDHLHEETGIADGSLLKALSVAAGEGMPKNGRLLVRQDFRPLFDAYVSIADEDQPLGTHLLVAAEIDGRAGEVSWNGYTLENRMSDRARSYYGIDSEASEKVEIATTLDRIGMNDELRFRLASLLTPGSSIAIADYGTERYTGWKTDFVVNTRVDREQEYALVPKAKRRIVRRTNTQRRIVRRQPQRVTRQVYVQQRDRRRRNPFFQIFRMW